MAIYIHDISDGMAQWSLVFYMIPEGIGAHQKSPLKGILLS
jgi:hypothetical protein